jgi:two-component system, sensor histidine kinase PdtaS
MSEVAARSGEGQALDQPARWWSAPRAIVVGTLVSIVLVMTILALFVHRDLQQERKEAELLARSLATVLAEHASQLFESAAIVMRGAEWVIGEGDPAEAATAEAHRALVELVSGIPYVLAVWIGDAEGRALLTTREYPTPDLSAADRAYFRAVRDDEDAFFIGLLPDNRYVDAVLINTSRRLSAPAGEFRGFIQVALSPEYLLSLYDSLSTGAETSFWLIDGELRPLLRKPALPVETLNAAPTTERFSAIGNRDEGAFTARSPLDEEPRRYGFRRTPGYDAYALVSIAESEINQRWRNRLFAYSWASLVAVIAIGGLGWFAYGRAKEERGMRRALAVKVLERTAALERALSQKDILLREVNHRVKNSLQIVSSLLQLQRANIADPKAATQFTEAAARVLAVARVHETLYRADSVDLVDLEPFLASLCEDLQRTLGGDGGELSITCYAAHLQMPTDVVIPIALIVSELVTNAYKYAAEGKTVEVRFQPQPDGTAELTVADKGPGLPADFDPARASGLGMRLVTSLAQQLGGSLEVEHPGRGTCVRIRLPAGITDPSVRPDRLG